MVDKIKFRVTLNDRRLQAIGDNAGREVRRRVIHDGVEYGMFVELGTSRMAARPNLVPAFVDVIDDLPEAIGQAVEAAVSLDDVLAKAAFDIQALWASGVPVDTGAFRNSITVSEE